MATQITVLGSGNAFCTDGRGNAAFLLEYSRGKILMDCGPTILQRAESFRVDLRGITAIFLTHLHGDHTFGLPFLLIFMKYMEQRQEPLTIVGPKGTKEWVNYLFEMAYPDIAVPFKIYYEEVQPGDDRAMLYLKLEVVPIDHTESSQGYRLRIDNKLLAFSGDSRWHRTLATLVEGADLAFVECSFVEKREAAHISLEEILESDERYLSGARQVVLIHLHNEVEKALAERNPYKFLPARDGQQLRLE